MFTLFLTRHSRPVKVCHGCKDAGVAALLMLLGSVAGSSVIPSSRMIAWRAGIPGGVPNVQTNVTTLTGAHADGVTDDQPTIQAQLNAITPPGVLLVPPGTYMLRSFLTIPSRVVLRGAGAGQTHFLVNLSSSGSAIYVGPYHNAVIWSSENGPFVQLTGGYTKGSTVLSVADASSFQAGNWVEIQEDNTGVSGDTSTWPSAARGQITQVTGVSGSSLVLEEPLHLSYDSAATPVVRRLHVTASSGVEYLSIDRQDSLSTTADNLITMRQTVQSWVRGVEGMHCYHHTLRLEECAQCTVRDSYVHDATNFSADRGYGILLYLHTTSSMVEDNACVRMRHGLSLGGGASGNVLGFNYVRDGYESDGSEYPADISMHGEFIHANLVEGNVCQRIECADAWGPAGVDNTIYRNRVEAMDYGANRTQIHDIDLKNGSNGQNVVGNEVVSGAVTEDSTLDPATELVADNYVNGQMIVGSGNAGDVLDRSFYRASPYSYFQGLGLPCTGADLPGGTNPAEQRYLAGTPVLDPPTVPYAADFDYSQYNFETGAQGWTWQGTGIAVAQTADNAYHEEYGLAVNLTSAPAGKVQAYVPYPPTPAGSTITFHVWLPSSSAVTAVNPFIVEGSAGGYAWHSNYQPVGNLQPGWNTITLQVPSTAATPLDKLGVEFTLGSTWSGTLYIDSVDW